MKKIPLLAFLYAIPYAFLAYLATYYFDYVAKAYPPFFPPAALLLLLSVLYLGLGCLCGRKGYASLCLFGTIAHLLLYRLCISFVLPALQIPSGVAAAWFPIWSGGIILSQLIGYWGTKPV